MGGESDQQIGKSVFFILRHLDLLYFSMCVYTRSHIYMQHMPESFKDFTFIFCLFFNEMFSDFNEMCSDWLDFF